MTVISVVIPTYNRAPVLPRAIESVLDQSFGDFELIIVDDGSTDHTEEVVHRYEDSRIRYLCFDENKGANAARNHGIQIASGTYISFLDSDDEFLPSHLSTVVAAFRDAPSRVAGIFTSYAVLNDNEPDRISTADPGLVSIDEVLIYNPIGSLSCTTFRADVLAEVGGFDPSFDARQDLDLYVRVLEDYEMLGIDEVLANHYRGDNTITSNLERRLQGHERFLDKHGEMMSSKGIAHTLYAGVHLC